jgi:hypothetical protein
MMGPASFTMLLLPSIEAAIALTLVVILRGGGSAGLGSELVVVLVSSTFGLGFPGALLRSGSLATELWAVVRGAALRSVVWGSAGFSVMGSTAFAMIRSTSRSFAISYDLICRSRRDTGQHQTLPDGRGPRPRYRLCSKGLSPQRPL